MKLLVVIGVLLFGGFILSIVFKRRVRKYQRESQSQYYVNGNFDNNSFSYGGDDLPLSHHATSHIDCGVGHDAGDMSGGDCGGGGDH